MEKEVSKNHDVASYVEHWEGRTGKAEAENASLRAQLAAMTEDRDLWRDEHNEGCPNEAQVEILKEQLAEATKPVSHDGVVAFLSSLWKGGKRDQYSESSARRPHG